MGSAGQSNSSTQATDSANTPVGPTSCNSSSRAMDKLYSDPLQASDPDLFQSLQEMNLDRLKNRDVSGALPFLVKLLLNPHFTKRKDILSLIYTNPYANSVIQYLQTKPVEPQDLHSITCEPPDINLFESGDADDRIKIVALEFLRIQEIARQSNLNPNQSTRLQSSIVFDNPLYVDSVTSCLFALLNRASNIPVMNMLDVSEALLHVKYGPTFIVRLVTNSPDRCHEICQSLITFGESQDECEKINEISEQRAKTIRALCQFNTSLAFTARSLSIQMKRMPSLTVIITLDRLTKALDLYNSLQDSLMADSDENMDDIMREKLLTASLDLEGSFDNAISFITGVLLGEDEASRTWFSQYIKSAQLKKVEQGQQTVLTTFRSLLLVYIQKLFNCFLNTDSINEESISSFKIDPLETNTKFLNRKLIQVMATLRAYCALRGIGMLKLNNDEHETLMRLVTCRHAASRTSINVATTGVCTLLVCSSMINNQKDEKRAAEWLRWLIKESNYSESNFSDHGRCSISELLLLIAIHFQNNHTNQIADLVHATLGLKLQAKFSVSKCKSLFVQEVFTDQMIAEHAVKVPVTKGLNNTMKEFLPIHCIHQLLESRSFSKHQVPIEDWIFKQICESRKPIHHMLPDLIMAYVNSIMISTNIHGNCGTNQPLTEERILEIFQVRLYSREDDYSHRRDTRDGINGSSNETKRRKKLRKCDANYNGAANVSDTTKDKLDPCSKLTVADYEVSQILLMYYLMLYEEVRLKELKRIDLPTIERVRLCRYNSEVMVVIPVFYLLQLIRDNQDSFGAVLPPILRLVASQYPHLCSIQHWLNTTEYYEPYKCKTVSTKVLDSSYRQFSSKNPLANENPLQIFKSDLWNQMIEGFATISQNPARLSKTISSILMIPRDEIWAYVDPFIMEWTKVLDLGLDNCFEHEKLVFLTTKLWWKFNTIFPTRLWVMTINSLRMVQNGVKVGSIKSLEYTWDELVIDPLIVLRCDSRIFRCPGYLNIVLHILNAYLAASRRCLQDQISEQTGRQKEPGRDKNLEELKTTLVLAQTSAAIQILLESCIPNDDEQQLMYRRELEGSPLSEHEQSVLKRFEESVSCICEHLHQVFIADTNLAKLVHFQTYPSELLATTSNKIPSMHICLDFIPELLSQPDISKQVFVIELTSHLCEKYAITKSLNVAKLCFNVAYTLLQILPSDKRAEFYIPALPALVRICKVFPILQEDARIILNQINQISSAHLASTSSRLSLSSSKPFEGLDKMSWVEVRDLMNSLDLHDALFICIQKCLLDLDTIEEIDKQQMQIILSHIGQEKSAQPAYNTIFAYGSHVTDF